MFTTCYVTAIEVVVSNKAARYCVSRHIFNIDTIHDCIQLKLGHLLTAIMSLPKISRSSKTNVICGSSEPMSGATGGVLESSCDSGGILGGATVGEYAFVSGIFPTDGAVGRPGYSGSQVTL